MDPLNLNITPQAAETALQGANTCLLDVREAHEVARIAYAAGQVVHIPLSQLEQRHAELPRNMHVIVACAAGGRSQQAMNFLLHREHPQVRNLAGGLSAWMAHGLPVRGSSQ